MKKILIAGVVFSLFALGATGCGDDVAESTTATDETTTTTTGGEDDAPVDATEGDVGAGGGEALPAEGETAADE